MAGGGFDLQLQRARVSDITALRITLPKLGNRGQRLCLVSLFVQRASLPVRGRIGFSAVHLDDVVEAVNGVGELFAVEGVLRGLISLIFFTGLVACVLRLGKAQAGSGCLRRSSRPRKQR